MHLRIGIVDSCLKAGEPFASRALPKHRSLVNIRANQIQAGKRFG